MHEQVFELVDLLRREQILVSTSEIIDAERALLVLGFSERESLRTLLATTLLKRAEDRPAFDRCFDYLFAGTQVTGSVAPQATSTPANEGENPLAQGPSGVGEGQGGGQGQGNGSGQALLQALQSGDGEQLAVMLQQTQRAIGLSGIRQFTQRGLFIRRWFEALGGIEAQQLLAAQAASPEREAFNSTLDRLREDIGARVDDALARYQQGLGDDALKRLSFAQIKAHHDIQQTVRRLARKLVSKHARRKRQQQRGRLDVRNTLRHNLSNGGVLFDLHWRHQIRHKPDLWVVCDVSNSVRQVVHFFLLLLHHLHDVLPQVRTFAFSDRLGEVSSLLSDHSPDEALSHIVTRYGMGSTDYAAAFESLCENHLQDLRPRSTLLFIGDARNNNGRSGFDALKNLNARVKQLLWLNPEAPSLWGTGDSEMPLYASQCQQVASCRSLADLEQFVDQLLLRSH